MICWHMTPLAWYVIFGLVVFIALISLLRLLLEWKDYKKFYRTYPPTIEKQGTIDVVVEKGGEDEKN